MRSIKTISTLLVMLAAITLQVSGQTLKERIDQVKEIKVYFTNSDIKHNPNTTPPPGSQNKGTGCPAFTETTPIPADFIEAEKQVIDLLNKGFATTVFVAGDISTVPVFTEGIQKGSQNWLQHGEPLVVWIYTTGSYNVENMGLMGAVDLVNSLLVSSNLAFYGIIGGKMKVLENKALVYHKTPTVKTKACDDYAYFVQNFPLSPLLDAFKTGLAEKTTDFTVKEMADYDKAMKKKK
jgi:hypothetical protein